MKTIQKASYTHIISEEDSVANFYDAFSATQHQFKATHLVLELSDNLNITFQEISLFLNLSKSQRAQGYSFILIASDVDVDAFPDDLNIVPTLVEAEDVLEMEAIERDLGF